MLELYCGNGNYTVSMSRHFDRVLGVERNAHLVQAAAWNIAINNCYSRALVITSPSEVFCSHVLSSRTYRHRPEHGTDGHIPSLGKGGQGGGGKGGGKMTKADKQAAKKKMKALAYSNTNMEGGQPGDAAAAAQAAASRPHLLSVAHPVSPTVEEEIEVEAPSDAHASSSTGGPEAGGPGSALSGAGLSGEVVHGAASCTEYSFNSVLCDPPRQGLDPDTIKLVQAYRHIIYISCNPDALKENLVALTKTHRVARFGVFDHFPYSRYIECGVYLVAKTDEGDAETATD
jgi:16S rRNA G966 N2-methylase RsmD